MGLQEVPDEISLCIGHYRMHSSLSRGAIVRNFGQADYGSPLTEEVYKDTLNKYKSKCSCICFMGGEWCQEELITYLQMARKMGYKTALYTGENWVGR